MKKIYLIRETFPEDGKSRMMVADFVMSMSAEEKEVSWGGEYEKNFFHIAFVKSVSLITRAEYIGMKEISYEVKKDLSVSKGD